MNQAASVSVSNRFHCIKDITVGGSIADYGDSMKKERKQRRKRWGYRNSGATTTATVSLIGGIWRMVTIELFVMVAAPTRRPWSCLK